MFVAICLLQLCNLSEEQSTKTYSNNKNLNKRCNAEPLSEQVARLRMLGHLWGPVDGPAFSSLISATELTREKRKLENPKAIYSDH